MLKHELVEALGIGDDSVIMGPIEDYVQALATERALPAVAVAACALRIEEAGPALRAALAQAAEGKFMTADEATLFFRGLHILGAARDRQGFQLLLRLLRCPADELEFLLGDTVTESLTRIVVGMFDGDTDGLLGIIADRTVDGFVRDALMMAAAFLTWEGRIDRVRMRDFLERFHADELADEQDFVWTGWIHAIGLLGMRELAPLVRDAWDEELIPEGLMEPDDFENDLAAAEAAPDDGGRFEAANVGYIEDAIMCLEGTAHFATSAEAASAGADGMAWTGASAEPYVNPLRNVGRNDPCPCGSGKKYKKCCLAA